MRFLIITVLVLINLSGCGFPENTFEIRSLTAYQAARLVRLHNKDLVLDLYGLESVSVDAANALAKFKGDQLYLGITSINKEVAKELARFKGEHFLALNCLTSIDKGVVEALSNYKGSLSFCGLTSIDKDVAQEVANRNECLSLGLTSIDKEIANALGGFKGDQLTIRLTSIDKDVAQELAKVQGRSLDLETLTSVDRDVAQELAKFRGTLYLSSRTSIDEDVRKILEPNTFFIRRTYTKP